MKNKEVAQVRPRIVFVSPMCLLDNGSGAAVCVRSWLELLAGEGCQCGSVTMSAFDGGHEYRMERVVGAEAARPENHGKVLRVNLNGVRHHIFYTRSTVGATISLSEQDRFLTIAASLLDNIKPDIVVSYGSSEYSRQLQQLARERCRWFIFYLANADFTDRSLFVPGDIVVCPSEFLADHYRQTLDLDPRVMRSLVLPEHHLHSRIGLSSYADIRKSGFVTFINPQPTKGMTLFWRLVRMALAARPDITFLAVEGRFAREQLQNIGIDLGAEPNVWWLPNQNDIRRVYRRTSLLLFPSFWPEASGRSIAEAHLSGIPVLGGKWGGIPEQMNGGGFLFDIPRHCLENNLSIPTEDEARPWLETIVRLLDDEAAYGRAVAASFEAGRPFNFERQKEALLKLFSVGGEEEKQSDSTN